MSAPRLYRYGFDNAGTIRAAGLDLESEIRLKRGVQLLASYALQHAKDADAAAPSLTNSPRHMAKLRLSVPGPRPRSFGSFEWQYLSSRATLAGLTVDPAVVANATMNLPINPSVMLTGQTRNLFNASYADPASDEHVPDSIEQNGRTIRFGLRWVFWRPK